MCENDRIDAPDIFAQGLCAEIGAGVDDECAFRCFHVNRRAQTLIPGVGRSTYRAIASDHRYALRGAGAEKGNAELRALSANRTDSSRGELAKAFGVEG